MPPTHRERSENVANGCECRSRAHLVSGLRSRSERLSPEMDPEDPLWWGGGHASRARRGTSAALASAACFPTPPIRCE